MIGIAIFYTLILALFWTGFSSNKSKEVTKISFVLGLCVVWLVFLFIKLGEYKPIEYSYLYLLFIPFIILFMWQVFKTGSKKSLDIVAKQQSYWGISPKSIYNFYQNRKIEKNDRIETKVNLEDKFLSKQYSHKNSFLTGNVFYDIKNLNLTKVSSVKEINNSKLYSLVLKKIEGMIKYLEKSVDFEEILKKNDMCVEYFLMDLWESYTQSFNIGTANLDVYAQNEIEKEFVGALDNIDLNSVKKSGAALFFSYMKFKKRLPSDIEKQKNLK